MHVEALPARLYALPTAPRQAARLSAFSLVVIGLFGFLLPIMWIIDLAGGQVNTCAADLLILPVLFLLRGRLLKSGSLGYWIFALWMINVVSWALSASLLSSMTLVRECLKLGTCYLYAFAGFTVGRDGRTTNAFVRGICWSAIPMAAVGIFAFFTHQPSWFISDKVRVAGTLGDPNAFGIYLGIVLPLVASAGIGWLTIPLFIGAGVVSLSRTGLAVIGAALGLNLLHLGWRRYLLVAAAGIFVFVTIYGIVSATRYGQRVAKYQNSLEERQNLWSLAAGVIADHPVLGVGKGNWEVASGSRILPHNTFLSVMVDGGIVGFTVFIIPIALWVARGIRRAAARPWAIAVFCGRVGGLAISLDNFRPFWLAIGVLVAQLGSGQTYQGAVAAARAGVRSPLNRHWR